MNILVTGATGFVGGRLATRLLSKGNRVVALCRDGDPPKGCEIVRGELEDMRACERAVVESEAEQIYHLAAQAIVPYAKRDPFSTLESNVRGTYNLLEAWRRHGRAGLSTTTGILQSQPSVSFVLASSDKAYGEMESGQYEETDRLEGRGPYDVSKSCADLIAQSYGMTYNMSIGIVRAGNIYGPGDDDQTRIIPSAVAALRSNKDPTIMSDGTPVRDYIWIDDVVDGYLAVGERVRGVGGPQAFNLSGGEPVTVLELVERLIKVVGYGGYHKPNVLGVRRGEISAQILNTEKAQTILGWKPRVSLDDGLWRTYWNTYDSQY